jgi:phosphoribosylformylglycinamidine synthase
LELPIAHGEGKFVPANQTVRQALKENDQIALVYTRPDGSSADGKSPDNPNGSIDDIAGVCDATGLVFGLMPHPERHLNPMQHPAWTSRNIDPNADGPGLQVFRNAFRYVNDAVGAGV